jgi:hypothetical protein
MDIIVIKLNHNNLAKCINTQNNFFNNFRESYKQSLDCVDVAHIERIDYDNLLNDYIDYYNIEEDTLKIVDSSEVSKSGFYTEDDEHYLQVFNYNDGLLMVEKAHQYELSNI